MFILVHLRMEALNVILPNLRPHDWAVTIVLKDAYLLVPVLPQSRGLLGFKFLDKDLLVQVVAFRSKRTPWFVSRVVATVIAHLRMQGIRIFCYLDNWQLGRRVPIAPITSFKPLFSWHKVWGSSLI